MLPEFYVAPKSLLEIAMSELPPKALKRSASLWTSGTSSSRLTRSPLPITVQIGTHCLSGSLTGRRISFCRIPQKRSNSRAFTSTYPIIPRLRKVEACTIGRPLCWQGSQASKWSVWSERQRDPQLALPVINVLTIVHIAAQRWPAQWRKGLIPPS